MDNAVPRYFVFGGLMVRVDPYIPDPCSGPQDPLSIDMALRGIARASQAVSCDHGVSLTDHCEECSK